MRTLPPKTDRGLAGQIMDAAWPAYGGNHQEAEFWEIFGQGVEFALECLENPPITSTPGEPAAEKEARHGEASREEGPQGPDEG